MKKYTIVSLAALTFLIAIAAGIVNAADTASAADTVNAVDTVSAADTVSSKTLVCNVVGTNYECDSWSNEQYPVIDLFGEKYVPLLANNDDIRDARVDKLAGLVLDSNETYTFEPGEILDLGQGYDLEVRQIDIDSEKVWLEFTREGQHVADQNISVDSENNKTWTVALDNVQGENDIVVMKVHVRQVFVGTEKRIVWINGIWLIDYANTRTLNIGDKFGEFTLEEIISGVDESNPGSLVFENVSVDDFSSSDTSGKEPGKPTDKSTGSFTSWYRDLWRCITMKCKPTF